MSARLGHIVSEDDGRFTVRTLAGKLLFEDATKQQLEAFFGALEQNLSREIAVLEAQELAA